LETLGLLRCECGDDENGGEGEYQNNNPADQKSDEPTIADDCVHDGRDPASLERMHSC
jgi:hypothetical protein